MARHVPDSERAARYARCHRCAVSALSCRAMHRWNGRACCSEHDHSLEEGERDDG